MAILNLAAPSQQQWVNDGVRVGKSYRVEEWGINHLSESELST